MNLLSLTLTIDELCLLLEIAKEYYDLQLKIKDFICDDEKLIRTYNLVERIKKTVYEDE